ncbi:MAG: tetratricopeptide repeat protein [Flavobacteriales bacterium]|nr:tetratricopeptide repeat protein [Flavobacteriales bacterium]
MIRVLFTILLLSLGSVGCPCLADSATDSLIQELDTMPNSAEKVDLMLRVSRLMGNLSYSAAMNYASLALELSVEIHDQQGEAESLRRKAQLYNFIGDFEKGITSLLEALKIYEKVKNKNGIALVYTDIGTVYNLKSQSERSAEYFEKALAIRIELDDRNGIASSYGNLGSTNRKLGNLDESLRYFNKGLEIAKEEHYEDLTEAFLNNMGNVYGDKGDYPKSLDYFKQFLAINEVQNDKRSMAICLSNMGGLYNKIGNHKLAVTFFERSLDLSDEINFTVLKRHVYQNITVSYEAMYDFDNAYVFLKAYSVLNDSIMGEKNSKIVEELRAKYESEKTERELLEKDAVILQGEEAAKRQDQMIYGVIAVLGLSIIFTMLIYGRFRIIRQQKGIIEMQKAVVDEKNKDITDSINYAKRIQTAMLKSDEELNTLLGEHFVFFEPKDVVSGDFYWCHEQGEVLIWVVADCTGHGVPGAFMSMIGNSLMNEIIIKNKVTNPGKILDELKAGIIKSLGEGTSDGMDMALCSLNRNTNELQFAGANNGLYITRRGIDQSKTVDGEGIETFNANLIEIKPDKQPVGVEEGKDSAFTTRTLLLEKGDCIYASSDGYVDQFGGKRNKKFSARRFKELLSGMVSVPMPEQKVEVTRILKEWQGDKEQIDDICVIGLRI